MQNFYQNSQIAEGSFKFSSVSEEVILKILEKFDTSKAAGIEGLPGIFIKDGANLLVKPVYEVINLSITSSMVPDLCKVSKLKPLFKKGSNWNLRTTGNIHFTTDI